MLRSFAFCFEITIGKQGKCFIFLNRNIILSIFKLNFLLAFSNQFFMNPNIKKKIMCSINE